jgi:Sulfotransferase family
MQEKNPVTHDEKVNELESKLVWMFGSPRTGSTWLLELIAHPLILEARDPLGFGVPADLERPVDVIPINESLLPSHLAPPQPEDPPARQRPWIRTPAATFGNLSAYFFSSHFEDVWRPAVRDLAHRRFGAHLERAEAEHEVTDDARIVIKEPNGSHAAPLILSLLPESRLIFLYRDGRDVVDSQLALSGPGGLTAAWRGITIETPEQRLELVREESLNWVARMEATERAYQERPPELRFRLGYEDLLVDPAGSLRSLMDWLGRERDSAAIAEAVEANSFESEAKSNTGAAATRRAAAPGLWRENLTESETALAHEIMGEKLGELGYLDSPHPTARTPS